MLTLRQYGLGSSRSSQRGQQSIHVSVDKAVQRVTLGHRRFLRAFRRNATDGASNLWSSRGINKTSLQVGENAGQEGEEVSSQFSNDATLEQSLIKEKPSENISESEKEQWEEWIGLIDQSIETIRDTERRMNEAVAVEDYSQATTEKKVIEMMKQNDPLEEIVRQLDDALSSEDYETASALRDQGRLSLLGWWVGKGSQNDPYGHLLHVTREYGRLVGRAYTPVQLQEVMGESQTALIQNAMSLGGMKLGGRGGSGGGQGQQKVKLEDTGNRAFEIYINEDGDTQPFVLQPCEESIKQLQRHTEEAQKQAKASSPKHSIATSPIDEDEEMSSINFKEDQNLEQLLHQKTQEFIQRQNKRQQQIDPQSSSESQQQQEQQQQNFPEIRWLRNPCSIDVHGVNRFRIVAPALSELQKGQQRVQLSATLQLASRGVLNDNAKRQQLLYLIQVKAQKLNKSQYKGRADLQKQLKKIVRDAFREVTGDENLGDDLIKESRQAEEVTLSNEVWYERMHLDYPLTDPFSGYYIGAFGPNGVEILQFRRTVDVQNQEWVVATKITGDANVPAGVEC
eukprot:TRINITY_DN3879_c0_g1_i1.p1 TRINITY_DN3879_c0_g1~~TRINITY_DN3879_c0_g1_i1.p1  ORF type:complete len:568 (-),score=100.21 TRINITY_DN3879_c0_g1_i1:114-1817(-)